MFSDYCFTGIDCEKKKFFMTTIAKNFDGNQDYFFFGTGSYPLVPQGWQREIRLAPSQIPLITPHSTIASMVYCEQEGVCLQCAPRRGEIASW